MKTQLITCNKKVVDQLILQNKIPSEFLVENHLEVYNSHQKNFPCAKFFYDRSQAIPYYLNVDPTISPLPNWDLSFNKSFYDIARERALELLATGKRINVSWSGGIDSTFVLFTLYNYANDKSQIKVYGTYNSVIESGDLFDRHIKEKFQYDIHTNLEYHENFNVPENELIVTGCMGNNIFYPELKMNQPDTWMLFKEETSSIKNCWDKPYYSVLSEENLIFLEPLIKKCPKKLETLQELRFWVWFTCNWYTTNSNRYIGIGPDRSSKLHSFFDTEDFQQWAMFNKDPQTKTGDYLDERWQMREYIAFNSNKSFAYSKKNCTSVLSNFGDNWLFLLNDYSNLYRSDLQSPTSVSYK